VSVAGRPAKGRPKASQRQAKGKPKARGRPAGGKGVTNIVLFQTQPREYTWTIPRPGTSMRPGPRHSPQSASLRARARPCRSPAARGASTASPAAAAGTCVAPARPGPGARRVMRDHTPRKAHGGQHLHQGLRAFLNQQGPWAGNSLFRRVEQKKAPVVPVLCRCPLAAALPLNSLRPSLATLSPFPSLTSAPQSPAAFPPRCGRAPRKC